ncbi:uncharacterized protein LOC107414961 [Ziziphus jujuba]|uniref:Uncharacterized protein LOC107414961 n=1 Tax=Ziziphus jujuba TaxID=326968 RepID=A0A6P3ZIW0_ZIZJJ|nr:uncharacterized protein LOC107414961 [Ziziphus jujuba]
MGGCASKPKESDLVGNQPAPAEAPAPAEQPAGEPVAQEKNGGESSKEEPPLVDLIETKEEVVVESKAVVDAQVPVPAAAAAAVDETAKPAQDKVEEKVETPKEKVEAVVKEETKEPAKEQVEASEKPLVVA